MLFNNSSCPNCGQRFTQAENLISCPACQSLLPEKMVQISTPETALRYISLRSPEAFRDERVLRSSLQDLLGRYFFQYRFVAELYKIAPRESAAFLEGNGSCGEEALRRSLCGTSVSRENIDRYIDVLYRSAGIHADHVGSVPTEDALRPSFFDNPNLQFRRNYMRSNPPTKPKSEDSSEDTLRQLLESSEISVDEEDKTDRIQKDYSYEELPDGTIKITGYNGHARNVTIPQYIDSLKVTTIGNYAFFLSEIESVVIPHGICSIEKTAFSACLNLASVQLPDTLCHLETSAFHCSGSDSLPLFEIPATLCSFGGNPFTGANFILHVAENHPCFELVDGVLFNYQTQTLVAYPSSSHKETFFIPAGTNAIGNSAISNNDFLRNIVIPEGVTFIGEGGISSNKMLESITIPNTVTQIGDRAFSDCPNLRSVELPDSVVKLGYTAFNKCDSLTSVRLPGSISALLPGAFCHCKNLTEVYLSDGVSEIGRNTFSFCPHLVNVRIPASVKTIAPDLFHNSPNVTATVQKGSYAASFCEQNGIRYRFEGWDFHLPRRRRS